MVICGTSPCVALTLVEMGGKPLGVRTALNLEKGITTLKQILGNSTETKPSRKEIPMGPVVVELESQKELIAARQVGREMACLLGFGLADQTRLITAISELTRNALQYAGGGLLSLSDISDDGRIRIRIEVKDHGPGIPDIEKAMSYGFTTGNGLGAGLPGVRSLLQAFNIESKPGLTTIIGILERKR